MTDRTHLPHPSYDPVLTSGQDRMARAMRVTQAQRHVAARRRELEAFPRDPDRIARLEAAQRELAEAEERQARLDG